MLGNDPDTGENGHKISISTPTWNYVEMKVVIITGAGCLAKI